MDSELHRQRLQPLARPPRHVRPRAEASSPLGALGTPSPPPLAETITPSSSSPTPRLGLAFILNDAPPATESRLSVLLPQRRQGQWSSPRPSPKPVDKRNASERRPLSMESLVWPEADTKDTAPWGGGSMPHERRDAEATGEETGEYEEKQELVISAKEPLNEEDKADAQPTPLATVASPPVVAPLSREEKRRGRTCRVDGCDNYIVHKGLCCRHGGARKCSTEGCDCTAKYMGLCWKHGINTRGGDIEDLLQTNFNIVYGLFLNVGGSTWCKVDGCSKRAKAKGRCWAHGGGTACSHASCTKVAVSNGLCWAHGGGKRCHVDGCNRPGYERTNGFCDRHFDEMQHVNYFEV